MAFPSMDVVKRAFKHLPERLQAVFLGPCGDCRDGLVAEILEDVLRNLERPARAAFKQQERWPALLRAMAYAFGTSLQHWNPSSHEPVELERLHAWAQERVVSQQLLNLITPNENSHLDIEHLIEELGACDLSAANFGESGEAAWLRLFVAGFYYGVVAEPTLHDLIPPPVLRQLAERMGVQFLRHNDGNELTGQFEHIRQLVARISAGENLQETLLDELQRMLGTSNSRGHVQQQAMYQAAEEALGQLGLASAQELKSPATNQSQATIQALLASIRTGLDELRQELDARPVKPSELELAEMEALYRGTLRDMFERLTFKGITQTGRAVSLPLEEVYVELKVVAEVPELSDELSAAERRVLHEAERQGQLAPDQDRELEGLRYHRWRDEARHGQTRIQRRSLDTLGNEQDTPARVILGDPGSGKTTLLHYLALRAIRAGQVLPIFVPLAAYDEYLRRTDDTVPIEQFLALYYAKWRNLRGLEPLFQRALESGRALILLDGLDEVLELTTRRFVAQQVSSLLGRWKVLGNRFFVTSRFIGYREVQLPGDLPHFMVLDFRPEEIEQFARKWCEAFEVWAVGGRRSDIALQRARQEEQALLADVNSKPSVAHLASNPLLLTMLALLRRQVGQLPARRIELYDRYVRMLLEHREINRSEGARRRAPDRLEPNVALQHLADLALWLQKNRPSGTARQRDMIRAMAEMALLREEKSPANATKRDWEDAEGKATRCLQEVRDIAGLIGERGHDAYGFLHLTFQEYLVGRALARESPERRWELLLPHLHDPRWRESILLCAGQLGVIEGREGVVADLVWRILDAQSDREAVLHRDLLLGAAVMADDVTRSDRILNELMSRLVPLRHSPIPLIRHQALTGLAQLVRLEHAPALEMFIGWLGENTLLPETIRALAAALRDEPPMELRERLLLLLENEDAVVRAEAVFSLGALAGSDAVVREALRIRLSDENWQVRLESAKDLRHLAGNDAAIQESFLVLLGDDDNELSDIASQELGAIAEGDLVLRRTLLTRLEDTSRAVQAAAVESLGPLVGRDPDVRNAILGRLTNQDWDVQISAVEALGPIIGKNLAVRAALLEHLNNGASYLRAAVVRTLGSHVMSDPEIRKMLLSLVKDQDLYVRVSAVEALSPFVSSDVAAREAIASLLEDEVVVRTRVVEALGGLIGKHPTIQEAVFGKLDDISTQVRDAAIRALGPLSDSDAVVRKALCSQLNDNARHIQAETIRELEALVEIDSEVREAFLGYIKHKDSTVRAAAATALGRLAATDSVVRELILLTTKDKMPEVRAAAVHALSASAKTDDESKNAILGRMQDEVDFVRSAAVRALGSVASEDADIKKMLLDMISDESDIRSEAVAALSSIADCDTAVQKAILNRLADRDFTVRDVAIRAMQSITPSAPEIRNALIDRLDDKSSYMQAMVSSALGKIAGVDAEIREILLARTKGPEPYLRAASVNAVAYLVGAETVIREAIFERLQDEDDYVVATAIAALGRIVESDSEVREAILSRMQDKSEYIKTAAFAALTPLAKSDGTIGDRIRAHLLDSNWRIRASAVVALVNIDSAKTAAVETFFCWLGATADPPLQYIASQVRSSIAKRIANCLPGDGAILERLLESLRHPEWQMRRGVAACLMPVFNQLPSHAKAALRGLLNNSQDQGYWPERLEVAEILVNARSRSVSEQAVNCALSALDYGSQPWHDQDATGVVRSKAARILGQLDPTHRSEIVLNRLLELSRKDPAADVCDAAYLAALRLVAAPAESLQPMSMLSMPPQSMSTILHLSDLHFQAQEEAELWSGQIAEDLKRELGCQRLDGVILSGDITNKSMQEGYSAAQCFLGNICREFRVSAQEVVLVPGNHDVCRKSSKEAYKLTRLESGNNLPVEGAFVRIGIDVIDSRDEDRYMHRFQRFAQFYERFKGEPYPLSYSEQGILHHFPEKGLLVLGLNSAWQIDHHFPGRASIHPNALARQLERIRQNDEKYQNCIKIAVWHHPLESSGEDRIGEHGLLEQLSKAGFKLILHGHIHKSKNGMYRYDQSVGGRRLEVVGAGTFGAPTHELVPGYPFQYNLLRFQGMQLTVETRRKEELNGAWKPDARWTQGAGKDPKPYYILDLS